MSEEQDDNYTYDGDKSTSKKDGSTWQWDYDEKKWKQVTSGKDPDGEDPETARVYKKLGTDKVERIPVKLKNPGMGSYVPRSSSIQLLDWGYSKHWTTRIYPSRQGRL